MNKIVFLFVLALAVAGCANQKKETAVEAEPEAVVLSVDELMDQAETLAGSEVTVKGTVMHVCQHGGQRCFLMGSGEEIIIRVEASEEIGTFSQEQMGSELEVVGIFKEVKTDAEAQNPGEEQGGEADEETGEAHQQIANAQETQEVEYYIQGIKATEVKPAESPE